jgi:hypothetical protein
MISLHPKPFFFALLLLAVYGPYLVVEARGLKGDAIASYEIEEYHHEEHRELITTILGPITTIVTLLTTIISVIEVSQTILCFFGGLGIAKCD